MAVSCTVTREEDMVGKVCCSNISFPAICGSKGAGPGRTTTKSTLAIGSIWSNHTLRNCWPHCVKSSKRVTGRPYKHRVCPIPGATYQVWNLADFDSSSQANACVLQRSWRSCMHSGCWKMDCIIGWKAEAFTLKVKQGASVCIKARSPKWKASGSPSCSPWLDRLIRNRALCPDRTSNRSSWGISWVPKMAWHRRPTQKCATSIARIITGNLILSSTESAPWIMPSLVKPSKSAVNTTAAWFASRPCSKIMWHTLLSALYCGGLGRTIWMENVRPWSRRSRQAFLRSVIQVARVHRAESVVACCR